MTKETSVAAINREFGGTKIPTRIVRFRPPAGESIQIERDYGSLSREDITERQAAMMTVDAPLMTDEAIAYFLPVLARAALFGGSDAFLLSRRLEGFDQSLLTDSQAKAITELIEELRRFDNDLEESETRDIKAGQEMWRRALRASTRPEDQLLLAAESGDTKGVAKALTAGADPEYTDSHGNSAVRLADINGHTAVLEILRDRMSKQPS